MNEAMEYFTPRTSLIGQDRLPLFDALVNYAKSEVIPFDVPDIKWVPG